VWAYEGDTTLEDFLLSQNYPECLEQVLYGREGKGQDYAVGRRRLPVSNPELKARLVSTIETKIKWTACKRCFRIQCTPLQRGAHEWRGEERDAQPALHTRRPA
jgi:hypothetical protein